ncbi:MAG: Gfo/Idh/MocA family oxidoreductase [Planctomycetes bacterium]|nr:Gfo/Idh/MocA family oxidoreductase [Planctomycetota bacterium]
MADRVRLGVVGCGVIAQMHLRAAVGWPTIDVVAVADLREDVLKSTAATHKVPRTYSNADALFADREVDAVLLAMPTGVRTALAVKALAAGKHVLLEKPVAMNAGEVRDLINRRGDRVVACCSSRHRFLASAKAATDFVATGKLGAIRVVRVRAVSEMGKPPGSPPPPWRLSRLLNGGGIMANWGCYDLDYVLGVAGWRLKLRLVLGQTWQVAPAFASRAAAGSDAETHVAALVRCAEGATLTIERGEFLPTQGENAWQIIGDAGGLRLNMLPVEGATITYDEGVEAEGVVSRVIWQGSERWDIIHEGPVRDFAAATLERRPPMTGLEQALAIQQITDAIYASSESGAAVPIA